MKKELDELEEDSKVNTHWLDNSNSQYYITPENTKSW